MLKVIVMPHGNNIKVGESTERRTESLNDLSIRIGRLEKGQLILETCELQRQQWQVNHRAETLGMIKELKDDIYKMVSPLVKDVNAIKRLIWMGGGGFGTLMLLLELYKTFGEK